MMLRTTVELEELASEVVPVMTCPVCRTIVNLRWLAYLVSLNTPRGTVMQRAEARRPHTPRRPGLLPTRVLRRSLELRDELGRRQISDARMRRDLDVVRDATSR